MKKGEIYQGVVSRMNFPNKGIVTIEGTDVMVKNALPGQTVSFRISKKRHGQAEGNLLEVVEKAPCEIGGQGNCIQDIEVLESTVSDYNSQGSDVHGNNARMQDGDCVRCNKSGICGGCLYQGFPYEEQLKIKEEQVLRLLEPYIGPSEKYLGIASGRELDNEEEKNAPIYDGIKASPKKYGYRNKMEFTFGDEVKDGPLSLGLHKRGSFYDILTVSDCLIMDEDYRKILAYTRDYFAERQIPYFHRMNHTGYLRHLLVRKAAKTGQILVALVTSTQMEADLKPWADGIKELLKTSDAVLQGILHIENDSLADAVRCDRQIILYGTDEIMEELLGMRFSISVFSFFQTNSLGAEVLYQTVREYVKGKEAGGIVYDLYSGTGTIAQMLAPAAKKVIGVEIVEDAVEAARKNAAMNGLDNCEFLAGDVLKVLDEITEKPDYIILDPPRDGVHPKALKKIIGYGVENMVYISCKPTSLARDLPMLTEEGYEIKRFGMVDMFPWTGNVETVYLLSKLNVDHHIEVEINLDEMDLTVAESKATYEEIKAYVKEQTGLSVSTLYIAQVKRKCGIIERANYNQPKSEDSKQPKCPPEKEEAIKEALKYFNMI